MLKNNKFTIIVCIITLILNLFSVTLNANSLDLIRNETNKEKNNYDRMFLKDYPIYLVNVRNENQFNKDLVSGRLNDIYEQNINKNLDKHNELNFNNNIYMKVDASTLYSIIDDSVLDDTFKKVEELKNTGNKINYVTFLYNSALNDGDMNNPDWWEKNFEYFDSYGGYRFLYTESAINYSGNTVELLSNNNSQTWSSIFRSVIKLGVDELIDNYINDKLTSIIDLFKIIFNNTIPTINLTKRDVDGYIDVTPHPTVRLKYVYIQDKLNKIPGYAYYEYGRTQMVELSTNIYYKLPSKKRPGGWTYDYITGSEVFNREFRNKGFYGSREFLNGMIRYYENGTTNKYEERLNWRDIVVTLER